jgi:hypothetical protein
LEGEGIIRDSRGGKREERGEWARLDFPQTMGGHPATLGRRYSGGGAETGSERRRIE